MWPANLWFLQASGVVFLCKSVAAEPAAERPAVPRVEGSVRLDERYELAQRLAIFKGSGSINRVTDRRATTAAFIENVEVGYHRYTGKLGVKGDLGVTGEGHGLRISFADTFKRGLGGV